MDKINMIVKLLWPSFYWWCWVLSLLSWLSINSVSCKDNATKDHATNESVKWRTIQGGRSTFHMPWKPQLVSRFDKGTDEPEKVLRPRSSMIRQVPKDDDLDEPTKDPLRKACKNIGFYSNASVPLNISAQHRRHEKPNPLKCYKCESSTKSDKEPLCDHRLWKYLKYSEKTRLRETCGRDGKFCAKVVHEILGERITTRSCFGETFVFGPKNETISSISGCMMFKDNKKFWTTLCLCDTDFCNIASKKLATQYFGLIYAFLFCALLHYSLYF